MTQGITNSSAERPAATTTTTVNAERGLYEKAASTGTCIPHSAKQRLSNAAHISSIVFVAASFAATAAVAVAVAAAAIASAAQRNRSSWFFFSSPLGGFGFAGLFVPKIPSVRTGANRQTSV